MMKKTTIINIAEIAALLVVPMLSSQLGFYYILLVLTIIFLSKYLRKEKFEDYGFTSIQGSKVLLAAMIGLAFAAFSNYIQEPLVSELTGEEADLSSFDHVKGNFGAFLVLLAMGWIIGGLFEEFLFRGYLLRRIEQLVRNPAWGKWAGILVTSASFALAHTYQGIGGIINTFIFSVIMGMLFYGIFKRSTWYVILVHGFFDTFGILWIYLGW